ncbi:MAG: hypothetical protein SNJ72_02185 [Fimbriimonadales bacterium]
MMRRAMSLALVGTLVCWTLAQESAPTFQYRFKEGQQEQYEGKIELNGNLPIPGAAGMAGSLVLNMTMFMRADKVDESGTKVTTGLQAFEAIFNGQPFPVGLDMAKSIIPDSTATVSPQGKLGGLQGGGGLMGFQLPGFDPRNMATMLVPTEIPSTPMTNGATWEFTRAFGDGADALKVTLKARYEGMEEVNGTKYIKIIQNFEQPIESYQDAFYQPTTDKNNAVRITRGTMKGTMTLWFHPEDGVLYKATIQASLDQTTEPIKKDGSEIKDFERETTQLALNGTITRKAQSGAAESAKTSS